MIVGTKDFLRTEWGDLDEPSKFIKAPSLCSSSQWNLTNPPVARALNIYGDNPDKNTPKVIQVLKCCVWFLTRNCGSKDHRRILLFCFCVLAMVDKIH